MNHQKNSYERGDYESVRAYHILCPEKWWKKKKNWFIKGWRKWKINKFVLPFNVQEDIGVSSDRNFNSILRMDHQKNSYERRGYESVG